MNKNSTTGVENEKNEDLDFFKKSQPIPIENPLEHEDDRKMKWVFLAVVLGSLICSGIYTTLAVMYPPHPTIIEVESTSTISKESSPSISKVESPSIVVNEKGVANNQDYQNIVTTIDSLKSIQEQLSGTQKEIQESTKNIQKNIEVKPNQ